MNILAFDTCWTACSAAIARREGTSSIDILAERFAAMTTGQAEALPVMFEELLAEAKLGASEIDLILVPAGPGSFTGVRIGVAAARALKLATGAEIATTTSLHLIAQTIVKAHPHISGGELMVAMDARRDEAYIQLFDTRRNVVAISPPQIVAVSDAAKTCSNAVTCIAGTAAASVARFRAASGSQIEIFPDALPNALDFFDLVAALPVLDQQLVPVYLRPPDAKPPTAKPVTRKAMDAGS